MIVPFAGMYQLSVVIERIVRKSLKFAHNITLVCSFTDTTNKMACRHEFESFVIKEDHFNFPQNITLSIYK